MKILVTGGAGFIGSHIVDLLIERGYSVRILDNIEFQVHRGNIPEYLNPNAEFLQGDIRNKEDIKEALKDVDVVFHMAAAVGVGQSMYEIERYVHTNTLGTALLWDVIVNEKRRIKKFIVASSMSNYGEGAYECKDCGSVSPKLRSIEQLKRKEWEMFCPKCGKVARPIPTPEEKPLESASVYSITKKDEEELSLVIGKAYDIPTIALRYFNVYGVRQALSNPYTGAVAIFSSRIMNGNPPLIFEDGNQLRDLVNVKDVARASVLAMENESLGFEVLNVGTGKPTSILKLAKILIQLLVQILNQRSIQVPRRRHQALLC